VRAQGRVEAQAAKCQLEQLLMGTLRFYFPVSARNPPVVKPSVCLMSTESEALRAEARQAAAASAAASVAASEQGMELQALRGRARAQEDELQRGRAEVESGARRAEELSNEQREQAAKYNKELERLRTGVPFSHDLLNHAFNVVYFNRERRVSYPIR
jgi:hypothetical protein